jgi:FkbH-like protein
VDGNLKLDMEDGEVRVYRVSPYVQCLPIDEYTTLVGHPFFLSYSVLQDEMFVIFHALREAPTTPTNLAKVLSLPTESIDQAITFFTTRHFVLTDGEDEESQIRNQVLASRDTRPGIRSGSSQVREYRDYAALKLQDLKARVPFERTRNVNVIILGGCLTQLAANALEQLAPSYGISARVESSWPDRLDSMRFDDVDLVVFQPFTMWLLAPLWDAAAFLADEERGTRLQTMKEYLKIALGTVLPRLKGRLLLVQTISRPVFSPLGRTEFRHTYNFCTVVHELNQTIADAIKGSRDAMLIDEECILSNVGKSLLLDHSVSVFSHHGTIDMEFGTAPAGPTRRETFAITEPNLAPRMFAQAYLEAFVIWSGIGRIKCVIVDLDNTLWPGVVGENGFDVTKHSVTEALVMGTFGGIHQALKIVKQRGVLLAICSRNNESDADVTWQQLENFAAENGAAHLLCREDFVIRKINWERKSANVGQILESLGVAPDAALFIDDNPAEREEVQTSFPALRVLGENIHLIRAALLDDPCLQNDTPTAESNLRTAMVKSQLLRDAERIQVGDALAFLRKLDISLNIKRITMKNASQLGARIMELFQRTNQFNTTLVRFSGQEIIDLISLPQGALYALEVTDRFSSYGLVGLCALWEDEISGFVLSCRVIPLCAAVPFLSAVLARRGRIPIRATIVEGPRNQPCRQLYVDAGFHETEPGKYLLTDLARLHPIDPDMYRVELDDAIAADDDSQFVSRLVPKRAPLPSYSSED